MNNDTVFEAATVLLRQVVPDLTASALKASITAQSQPTRLFTIDESAAWLKVSRSTVRRLIDSGRLKAYKIAQGVRINQSDLNKLFSPINSEGK